MLGHIQSEQCSAFAMFQRRCEQNSAASALVELAWTDAQVRDFWIAEAEHVLAVVADAA
jgi:hypothetical protein